MKQHSYEKLLGIKTQEERKVTLPYSRHYNPYEATSYEVLETLLENYEVDKNDHIVDFGCGKGRLNFFLHHYTGATVKGIEMDEKFIEDAIINHKRYIEKHPAKGKGIEFVACLAEEYQISEKDNRFYFFNPFSVHIFQKVVNNILHSVEKAHRSVDIILFYPHEEYIQYLENKTAFELVKEIRIEGLYETNNNERILIYRYPAE